MTLHPVNGIGNQPFVVSQPLNDVLALALVASHLDGTPEERVAMGVEIICHAAAAVNKIPRRIREIRDGDGS